MKVGDCNIYSSNLYGKQSLALRHRDFLCASWSVGIWAQLHIVCCKGKLEFQRYNVNLCSKKLVQKLPKEIKVSVEKSEWYPQDSRVGLKTMARAQYSVRYRQSSSRRVWALYYSDRYQIV